MPMDIPDMRHTTDFLTNAYTKNTFTDCSFEARASLLLGPGIKRFDKLQLARPGGARGPTTWNVSARDPGMSRAHAGPVCVRTTRKRVCPRTWYTRDPGQGPGNGTRVRPGPGPGTPKHSQSQYGPADASRGRKNELNFHATEHVCIESNQAATWK